MRGERVSMRHLLRLSSVAGALIFLASVSPRVGAQAGRGSAIPTEDPIPGQPPGALSKANLAKPRPKPPFDLTGNWMYSPGMNRDNGVFGYLPLPKLKPAAQASYDASQAAAKEG